MTTLSDIRDTIAPDVLVGCKEVAQACRVQPHSVSRWVQRGKLMPRRVNNRVLLFDRSQVERMTRRTP